MTEISNSDPQLEIYKKRFFEEVQKGNLVMIKAMAKKKPELLNSVDEHGWTALHFASLFGKLNVVQWLLSDEGRAAGFNSILSKTEANVTALDLAAKKGDLECFKAIVYGCKVENGEREQMLNAVNEGGLTVLHIAAMEGDKVSIIKWLLSDKKGGGREAGFHNVLARYSKMGLTALHLAAQHGDLECFKAIVEGCKVENGEREQMLNALDETGATVLICAAEKGHSSIIKWLLSKGRDLGFTSIPAKDYARATALQVAAQEGHLEACKAIVERCKAATGEREKMLNAPAADGCTALHYAAVFGHTSVVSWLLSDKQGGGRTLGFKNVLARTEENGHTALHIAAQHGHYETFKAILEGCKVDNGEKEQMLNAVDNNGFTVLHYAAGCGHANLVSWLLSHDADGGRALGLKSETITSPAILSQCSLHCVAQSGSVETLRALLSGCTVGERLKLFLAVDKWGWTPLHYAAQCCQPAIIRELLLHHEETKMIVDHRDHRGMTALHRAVLDGGVDEVSKKEWKLGVDPDDDPNLAPREEVVEALLTCEYEYGYDEDEAVFSTNSKKRRRQQQDQHEQEQEEEEQQAAYIDVNLGLKIEKRE